MKSSLTIPQWQVSRSHPLMWTIGLVAAMSLWLLMVAGQFNLLFTVIILSSLLLVSMQGKVAAILATFAFLVLLGDIRRLLASLVGPTEHDLLLLIGPVIAASLAFPIIRGLRLRDGLSKAVFFLLVVMVLEIFNPRQGSLAVGLSGAIFYIAPVLWFWIGRRFGSPEVITLLVHRIVLPLAVLAALLGFAQTFIGFLPYEQEWINVASKTYTALHLGASIRAFGFSVSAAEYATLLTIGAVAAAASYFATRSTWVFAFPVLCTGIILASARGSVIRMVFALAVVWTLRRGQRLHTTDVLRLISFAVGGLAAVALVASHFASSTTPMPANGSVVDNALAHQASGLAHPFDPRYSTAGIHSGLFLSGVVQGLTYPIGHGLGSTTEAAGKFGGDPSEGSSEIDISDMFISLGLVGGVLYLYVVIATLRQSLAYMQTVKPTVSLPVVAILVCTLGSWLIGGQYSTSSLILFLAGSVGFARDAQLQSDHSFGARP